MRPGDPGDEIDEWCDAAAGGDPGDSRALERRIRTLREHVTTFNLPFLSLPVGTPPEVAIDVFVKMNTSAVALTPFDIVVAQVEAATGQPLRDFADELHASVPALAAYIQPADLILNVVALRQDRSPTQASAFRLDLQRMVDEWDFIVRGVRGAIAFLEEERVLDRERLPTVAVIPILAAVWSSLPTALDSLGAARTLLRRFLWRAFFTKRYENAAGTRALQDYRALQAVLSGTGEIDAVPVFDDELSPLPTAAELKRASWPKQRDTLARAILVAAMRGGGLDLADASPASRSNLAAREYHHLFPERLLEEDGDLPTPEIYRALNCALITWNTNRNISAKEPVKYLKERTLKAPLGEGEVRARVGSHAIPFDLLNVGGYAEISDIERRRAVVRSDYEAFLDARAQIVEQAMQALCRGETYG